jgi:flagellar hook-length control protein FliK
MMTQSVMTQAAVLSRNSGNAFASKVRQSANGFDQVMSNNLKSSEAASAGSKASGSKNSIQNKDPKTDIKASDEREAMKAALKKSEPTDSTDVRDKTDAGADQTKELTKAEKPEDTGSKTLFEQLKAALTKVASDDVVTDEVPVEGQKKVLSKEEIMEQILNLLQNVQEKVMEILKLSPEELNSLLNSQGLDMSDLTDPEALKQLVLKNSGKTDVLDFLTDEDLAKTLNELVEKVEAMKDQTLPGITAEQLKAAIRTFTGQEEKLSEPTAQEETGMNIRDQKEAYGKQNLNGQADGKDSSESKAEVEVVKITEGGGSTGQTKAENSKDQAQDNTDAKQYETFLNNLTKAATELKPEFTGEDTRVTELREIANQIIERIRVIIKPEQTSMELQLNPENLGKVNLTVQSKAGAMTAHFTVQNEMAKEAIEGQLQTLKDTLNAQGIKVEAIEVTVTSYTFGQEGRPDKEGQTAEQNKNQGRRITLEDAVSMSEEPEEESISDITGISGTNIDMTA